MLLNGTTHKVMVSLLLLQECPLGTVDEHTFRHIYAQFFPQGGWLPYYSTRHFLLLHYVMTCSTVLLQANY